MLSVECLFLQEIFLHDQVDGSRHNTTATDVVTLTVAKRHRILDDIIGAR